MTRLDDITALHFLDMRTEDDWKKLPAACPVNSEELWRVSMHAGSVVCRSPLMLSLADGKGTSRQRLALLLSRMWTAGYKTGVAHVTEGDRK